MGDIIDKIVIVLPVLNEARHIEACLTSLLAQAKAVDAHVMVIDGGSTDATRDIVQSLQPMHARLALVDNPARLQSAAVNLAERLAPRDATVMIRADAHAHYPDNFVALCVSALRAQGATSVVVPMQTVAHGGMQRAIAAAQNSRLGNGGAAHRAHGVSGPVDHGHHAAFDLAFFRKIGGYDTSFSHNEDAEHDVRAHVAGGRVWMCREAPILYIPRDRLWPLARQYARHGAGRARTLLKHRLAPRPRQLAAPAILVGCLLGLILSPITTWSLVLPALYAVGCVAWSCVAAWRARDALLLAMAPAAMTMHLSWAVGFFRGLARG